MDKTNLFLIGDLPGFTPQIGRLVCMMNYTRYTTLAEGEDEWLNVQTQWGGQEANNYFKWFHVCEDELSHRGQIRWLRKRASS